MCLGSLRADTCTNSALEGPYGHSHGRDRVMLVSYTTLGNTLHSRQAERDRAALLAKLEKKKAKAKKRGGK